jgi:hypothetical protein
VFEIPAGSIGAFQDLRAITDISIFTFFGKAETCIVSLAGNWSVK